MGCWDRSGLNVVKVSVADVCVEHEVKLEDFTKWLNRTGGSFLSVFLRAQGVSWKRIAAEMGVGVGAIYRVALEGSGKGF
jgi:hypothetical protein